MMSNYSKSESDDPSYESVYGPSPINRRLNISMRNLNMYEKSDWQQVSALNKSLSNEIHSLKNRLNKKSKELEDMKTERKKEKKENEKLKRENTMIKRGLSTKKEEMKAKEKSHMEEIQFLRDRIDLLVTTERELRDKINAFAESNGAEEYEREKQNMLKSQSEIQELKEAIEELKETIECHEMALTEKDQLLEKKAAEADIMERGFGIMTGEMARMTGEMDSLKVGQTEMRNEFREGMTQLKHIMQAAHSAGQINPVNSSQAQTQHPKREKADEFLPPIIKNKQDKQDKEDKPWKH